VRLFGERRVHLRRPVVLQRGEPGPLRAHAGCLRARANIANPDGIGIPKAARNPDAAAKFIKWFTDTANQAAWAGLNGPKNVIEGFPLPARLSSLDLLAKSGRLAQASELAALLRAHARAPFPAGAPSWYAQFSNAVYTNIHQAAAGQETTQQAVKNIATQASQLKASG
jgi:multiple sugar transport system substrate-binding protein